MKATYPTYQWRTPIIAAAKILKTEPVSGPSWKLPQPTVTQADLDKYVNDKTPPLHYAMCGCEDLPDYPQRWGRKQQTRMAGRRGAAAAPLQCRVSVLFSE